MLTLFNQSYNCQTSHYLGRNRLPKPFLMLPSLLCNAWILRSFEYQVGTTWLEYLYESRTKSTIISQTMHSSRLERTVNEYPWTFQIPSCIERKFRFKVSFIGTFPFLLSKRLSVVFTYSIVDVLWGGNLSVMFYSSWMLQKSFSNFSCMFLNPNNFFQFWF